MNLKSPVWVYHVEHLDKTKRGYYAAGPDNQLFYPFFVPSSNGHDQLYITRKTDKSPLFGEHEDQPLQIYDQVTLSPHTRTGSQPISELERSIYQNINYGREVIDMACFDAHAWLDVWQSQSNNRPGAQHIIDRTRKYLQRTDNPTDALLTQAQAQLREHVWSAQAFYKALDTKFSEQPNTDAL